MRSLLLAAMACLGLASTATALEIKNIRNCYAPPFSGATRANLKILGGDLIFITYDIEGLVINPKTGKASFVSTLELHDGDKKSLYRKDTPSEVFPQLGGNTIPGEVNVEVPPSQKPGKYTVTMTITDKEGKDSKSFTYPFEVLPPAFGVVGVSAPAVSLVGTLHTTYFGLVHMKLDDKNLCKVDVVMRVLDTSGKQLSKLENNFPKDLPPDTDLGKANFLPWSYPIYVNRTGRFIVEIVAKDLPTGATTTITYPFVVIDATTVLGEKK